MPRATSRAKLGPERTATGWPLAQLLRDQLRHADRATRSRGPWSRSRQSRSRRAWTRRAAITCRMPCDGTAAMTTARRVQRRLQRRRGGDSRCEADPRKVGSVFAGARDLVHQRGIASPQPHVVADALAMHRERRAPAAGSENGDLLVHRRRPMRRSVPAAILRRLARWRNRMSMPLPAAATRTG